MKTFVFHGFGGFGELKKAKGLKGFGCLESCFGCFGFGFGDSMPRKFKKREKNT